MPTAAAAPGHLHRGDRRARAGRSTIRRRPSRSAAARRGRRFPGNTIPVERMDPVARALLQRYPLPTSAGTANNYRRVGNETVDQDQFSVRIDHQLRDESRSGVRPADALPGGLHPGHAAARRQRRDHGHARAAGHDGVVVRVELSADVLDQRRSTSCASATRGERSAEPRRSSTQLGVGGLEPARHSVERAVSRTRCRRFSSAAISSSDRRRTPRPISAPA